MSDFTIGKPIPQTKTNKRLGQYAEIVDAALALRNGDELPVEFTDKKAAYRFVGTSNYLKAKGLKASVRGTVVYVSKRDEA